MGLTAGEIEQYERDGYLALPHLFRRDEIAGWLRRVEELVREQIPRPEGIRLQIEPGLADGHTDPLHVLRKIECLALFDDRFRQVVADPRLLSPLSALLGPDIKLFRDALMMKPARHGSAKPYHQDSAYWTIDPPDLCSAWIALDDATEENGCMRLIPGSHHSGLLEHQHLADYQVDEETLDRSREVSVPLESGGVLLFHSRLLHATSPNRSDRSRRAMIFSYMSARSRYTGPLASRPHYPLVHGQEYPDAV